MKTNHPKNLAAERHFALNRRHFLRGLGACIALPAFESLGALKALATPAGQPAITASGAPLRTAFLYFPNGAIPAAWWPREEGRDFTLDRTLKPLEALRPHLQVLGGMDQKCAYGGADGGGDHARGNGVFLTGVRLKKSATDIRAGISIDQAIAREVGHLTRFPSLELSSDAIRTSGACDSGYALVRHFVGQWLQTRDIETVTIDARQVLNREIAEATPAAPAVDPDREKRMLRFRELRAKEETNDLLMTAAEKKELQEVHDGLFGPAPAPVQTVRTNQPGRGFRGFRGFRGPRAELTGELRRAMRQETEKTFDYILREDRSLLELLDSDYTFLNERLARHYGLTNLNVQGEEMVRVKLPPDSPRGGVLTHGSVLAVTSNPTRTSPVKRGLFILDNLLGTPPPPPPPDIPPLEDAAKAMKDKKLTLRETLALHREQPLCSSCHNRMDPLGLALENFNAMGMWRDQERGQPVDATGMLLSGESFTNIIELKKILARNHATEFYRTITEKLLTYALGRGLDYYDVATVDGIVDQLEKSNGRPSALLTGILESAPFQKTRRTAPVAAGVPPDGTGNRASMAP